MSTCVKSQRSRKDYLDSIIARNNARPLKGMIPPEEVSFRGFANSPEIFGASHRSKRSKNGIKWG